MRQCFQGIPVEFIANINEVPDGAVIAVWGMKSLIGGFTKDVKILRLEDGFLRSVGLGADLIRPLSWVVDSLGIYYDATKPSSLEVLLANTIVTPSNIERAKLLRERIVAEGLTKYNVGVSNWHKPVGLNKKIILVPGQVESDASLAYGAPKIRSNIGLLQAVRQSNPGSFIVYKPHPDVIAGLRAKGVGEDGALSWCDVQITDANMGRLLTAVDEVHVLTSLAGFEALLRGKPVTCYGQPFYSGWGLTTDIVPNPRRIRQLSLDELILGVLIEYPIYLSHKGNVLITPEQALDELSEWQARAGGATPWWREWFRVILRLVVGVK